jgi:Tfp pilus assembly protein PilF
MRAVEPTDSWWGRTTIPAAIGLATFIAFLPALRGQFLGDDFANFVNNPSYRGLDWSHLRWIWTNTYLGPYQPLSWLSSAVDYCLWGMNPFGYHLDNLLIHCVNAALFYRAARLILGEGRGAPASGRFAAVFSALAFSLHPLRVEAVASAGERRTLLAGFFFLWTVIRYLEFMREPERKKLESGRLAELLVLTAGALLSKGISMCIPITLLALDVYPLRRLTWEPRQWLSDPGRRVLLEKAPFFGLCAAFCLTEIGAYRFSNELVPLAAVGWDWRIANAFFAATLYLRTSLWPLHLPCNYEFPVGTTPFGWFMTFSPVVAAEIVLVGLAIRNRRRRPMDAALWLHYFAALAPVLGLLHFANGAVAGDRYSYISCMGWSLLPGAILERFWREERRGALLAGCVALLCLLGVLSWRQAERWKDSESLLGYTIEVSPQAVFPRNMLGAAYMRQGRLPEAIALFEKAKAIDPHFAEAYHNLATVAMMRGDWPAAEAQLNEALAIRPLPRISPDLRNKLGLVLIHEGKTRDALAEFTKGLSESSRLDLELDCNSGGAYSALKEWEQAERSYRAALAIDPRSPAALNGLGAVFLNQGRYREAVVQFSAALAEPSGQEELIRANRDWALGKLEEPDR